ncbi:hypothetical protein MY10362_004946 [Beauveria mimosiformis]
MVRPIVAVDEYRAEKTRAPKLRARETPSAASRPREEPRIPAARDLGNILLWAGQHINGRIGLSLGSHVSRFPDSEAGGDANAELLSSSEPSLIGLIDICSLSTCAEISAV